MTTYKTTVGIEIHVELKTNSKMFCGCKNDPHASEPNTHICPVCLAHPGTLPVVNQEAVKKVMLVGAAINAKNADFSEFDRKNYFYPDIPKAYQISQYKYPLVAGGLLAGVAITRIHLEEDTARSQHEAGEHSLVDFNRAGVPLMELVTEPVIHTPEQAGAFARELQLLLRTLGVSDANMEKGEMRVEANISVSNTGQMAKTYVEVKNLNSFKAMEAAIEFETKRQINAKEKGESVIQETRGWNDQKSETFSQRTKEAANDYRYFPDPDIPKYAFSELTDFSNSRLSEIMPILPDIIRRDLAAHYIPLQQIELLLSQPHLLQYLMATIQADSKVDVPLATNYLTSDVPALLSAEATLSIESVTNFAELITFVANKKINSRTAKDLLKEVVMDNVSPLDLATDRSLFQDSSTDSLAPVIKQIIADNAAIVDEYRNGKEAVLKFLVGQGMKQTRGAGDPEVISQMLKDQI